MYNIVAIFVDYTRVLTRDVGGANINSNLEKKPDTDPDPTFSKQPGSGTNLIKCTPNLFLAK